MNIRSQNTTTLLKPCSVTQLVALSVAERIVYFIVSWRGVGSIEVVMLDDDFRRNIRPLEGQLSMVPTVILIANGGNELTDIATRKK